MPQSEFRTVYCRGEAITYLLERKNIRNINLRVRRDGQVYVSAPFRVPAGEIDGFVIAKGTFIQRALKRWETEQANALTALRCVSGEAFYYLGRLTPLRVQPGAQNAAELREGTLVLTLKDPGDEALRKKVFDRFWRERCEEVFLQTARAVYPWFQARGIPFPQIRMRDMKSRWGSCLYQKGIVTLNTQLLKYPPDCIRYVVIHEFSHFIHPNHSPAFWKVVTEQMPDWKRCRQVFKQPL